MTHSGNEPDSKQFLDEYNLFIGSLNQKIASPYWWAFSLGTKNQWGSTLYKNISGLLKQKDVSGKTRNRQKITKSPLGLVFLKIRKYLKFFLDSCWMIFTRSRDHYLARKLLKNQIDAYHGLGRKYSVLRSWIDNRSFDNASNYKDVFFGNLVDYLSDCRHLIILGSIIGPELPYLEDIKTHNSENSVLIIPYSYFTSIPNLFEIFLLQFRAYFNIKKRLKQIGRIHFRNVDITNMIITDLENEFYETTVFKHYLHYFAFRNFVTHFPILTLFTPFENHSWEILALIACRQYSPSTYFVGYQHGSILPSELNYFPTKFDRGILPLPDKIITVGNETKKILQDRGDYQKIPIKEGCALRFEYLFSRKWRERTKQGSILVCFPIGQEDSINLLRYLTKYLSKKDQWSILLKFHPVTPSKAILPRIQIELPAHFKVIEGKSIEELLETTEILIYSATTVCLEALWMGIPTIHVDINPIYYMDPAFGFRDFKWDASPTRDPGVIIQEIYDLSDEEFNMKQKKARDYTRNYFYECTKNNMTEFLKRDRRII